jgi:putative lipoic acid-binding regulatory protein
VAPEGPEDPGGAANDEAARARALALLEATHQFPCHYSVTVIAFNTETVTHAVRSAARHPDVVASSDSSSAAAYEVRPSREGKYLSHRFAVHVSGAVDVLALYARLRSLEGVVTIL